MKRKHAVLSLLLCLALCLALLPSFAAAATKIVNVSVELEAPVAGNKPVYRLVLPKGNPGYRSENSNTETYRNGIAWQNVTDNRFLNPDTGSFEAGKKYRAYIYLVPESGFSFDEADSITAKVNEKAATARKSDNGIYLRCDFGTAAQPISSVSVEIAPPRAGGKPTYAPVFPDGALYFNGDYSEGSFRNDVVWRNAASSEALDPDSDRFQAGRSYEVDIYLTAKEGYGFASGGVTATVNGAEPSCCETQNGQLYLEYVFDPLPETRTRVGSVSVEIAPPKAGEKPSYTTVLPAGAPYFSDGYSDAIYRNDLFWYNMTDSRSLDPDSDRFEAGKKYKVELYLTPKDGYAFDPDGVTARMNGVTVESRVEDSGQLYLLYVFDPLPEPSAHRLGDVNRNGTVDSDDAMLILRYDVRKIGADRLDLSLADVSGDGRVDSDDAMLVLRYDVKKISKFPAEK